MILVIPCQFFCKISQRLVEELTWNLLHTSMSPSGSIHPISVSAYPEQGHPGQVTSSSWGWHIKIIVVWENRDSGRLCYEQTVLLLPLCINCINFSPHFLSSTVKIICIKAGTEESRQNVSQVMEQVMLLYIEEVCSNFHPKIESLTLLLEWKTDRQTETLCLTGYMYNFRAKKVKVYEEYLQNVIQQEFWRDDQCVAEISTKVSMLQLHLLDAICPRWLTVIHTYIHTLMVVAAMQGADQHIRSSLGFSILPKDGSTCRSGESNR